MGIGDWGLGIGDWGLGPIPNPQSPIPNPQSPITDVNKLILYILKYYNKINYFNELIIKLIRHLESFIFLNTKDI